MNENRFKLHYRGSVGWLIFWFVIFFPVAFILLLTDSSFEVRRTTYTLGYDGSRFWLCFWFVILFPVALILLLVNGFSVSISNQEIDNGEVIETTGSKIP